MDASNSFVPLSPQSTFLWGSPRIYLFAPHESSSTTDHSHTYFHAHAHACTWGLLVSRSDRISPRRCWVARSGSLQDQGVSMSICVHARRWVNRFQFIPLRVLLRTTPPVDVRPHCHGCEVQALDSCALLKGSGRRGFFFSYGGF